LKLPDLKSPDLTLLTIRRGNKEATAEAAVAAVMKASCSAIKPVVRLGPAEGAATSSKNKLWTSYSSERGLLAFVNAACELTILKVTLEGGLPLPEGESTSLVMKEQLPMAAVSYMAWDPSQQSVLAIALRGFGIALWKADSGVGCQMWAGMAYKSNLIPLKTSQKAFDPLFAKWNDAGQLAAGMADGCFAVYDAVNSQVFVCHKSGKHNSGITAGDWISSLFAPALALASTNVIKVSQGFDNVEWPATAMKLKLGKEAESKKRISSPSLLSPLKKAQADPEGLVFDLIRFSPSGKYLATVAAPNPAPSHKQVVVYELQDKRESLVVEKELQPDGDGATPFSFSWLANSRTLLVFSRSNEGAKGSSVKTMDIGGFAQPTQWPPVGTAMPGRLVCAEANKAGLVTLALELPGGMGHLMVLGAPSMAVLAELPLDAPPESMELRSSNDGSSFVAVSYQGGGLTLLELVA